MAASGPTCTSSSTNSMQSAYMASLLPPTRDEFYAIAQAQAEKETANRKRAVAHVESEEQGQEAAAKMIQKTFRGYRARREMDGYSLNPSARWAAAVREAQFRNANRPRPRPLSQSASGPANDARDAARPASASARQNWKRAGLAALRAGHDDSDSESCSASDEPGTASPAEKASQRERRQVENAKRRAEARTMPLPYFLEMLDLKHRYGFNLRVYHQEWTRSDAQEHFFYWLDHGAGRYVELAACPREQLEREQVRYLSREERQYYLVDIDAEGRLCWAKNGARIDTTEAYKDSIHGIVPADDDTPAFKPTSNPPSDGTEGSESSSSDVSGQEADGADKCAAPEPDNAPGMNKVKHVTASALLDKLLRKSVRSNTWIFVADTSFRLYVGMKSSGTFQHSSFLQGGRVSAAGCVKIKNGRLLSLSPLSGHYRTPSSNFRGFLRSIKAEGADMGRLSVSKSYVVLVGLETYVKTQKKSRALVDKLVRPRKKEGGKEADIKSARTAMQKFDISSCQQ